VPETDVLVGRLGHAAALLVLQDVGVLLVDREAAVAAVPPVIIALITI
jgi:hypothetical protein